MAISFRDLAARLDPMFPATSLRELDWRHRWVGNAPLGLPPLHRHAARRSRDAAGALPQLQHLPAARPSNPV
jgi:hypothetical protein